MDTSEAMNMPRGTATVREVMTGQPVVTAEDSDVVGHARNLMAVRGIHHLVIVRGEAVIGVLTETDILRHLAERGYELGEQDPIAAAMRSAPAMVEPGEALAEAAALMASRGVGCLPVVDKGTLLGILTATDVLRRRADPSGSGRSLDLSATAQVLMDRHPVVVAPETMLFGAVAVMADRRIRHLPVVNSARRVVGVLTDRDVRQAAGDPHGALLHAPTAERLRNTPVSAVMSLPAFTVREDAPLRAVAEAIWERRIGAVPVVNARDEIVGIISYVDLIRALLS